MILQSTVWAFLSSPEDMFIDFQREEKGGEREGEKHRLVDFHMCLPCPPAPTKDGTHNPGICPDRNRTCNPQVYGMTVHPTEPHQPGLMGLLFEFPFLKLQKSLWDSHPSPLFLLVRYTFSWHHGICKVFCYRIILPA